MDHYWLLTSTFYGNWLPGDRRGFVARVRDRRSDDPDTPSRVEHNRPDTPYDADIPALRRRAMANLAGEPVRVTAEQAAVLIAQFRETAGFRGWGLLAERRGCGEQHHGDDSGGGSHFNSREGGREATRHGGAG